MLKLQVSSVPSRCNYIAVKVSLVQSVCLVVFVQRHNLDFVKCREGGEGLGKVIRCRSGGRYVIRWKGWGKVLVGVGVDIH